MIKEFTGYGKTVEEATAAAKLGLGAPETADIDIEVVEMPKAKVLGLFGGKDAAVKASYDDGKREPKQKKAKPIQKEEKKEPVKREPAKKEPAKREPVKAAPRQEAPKKAPAKAVPKKEDVKVQEEKENFEYENVKITEEVINCAKDYLAAIVKGLGVKDAVIESKVEDGMLMLNIKCTGEGIIIGRRGETLDSIQYLTGIVTKNCAEGFIRVVVDTANYRSRRSKTLEEMARRNANYVLRTHRRYTFDPMNPSDRRVIHTTVQGIEGVESFSTGTGEDRRVVIAPEGSGAEKHRQYDAPPAAKPVTKRENDTPPKADRADLPKFGKIEKPGE